MSSKLGRIAVMVSLLGALLTGCSSADSEGETTLIPTSLGSGTVAPIPARFIEMLPGAGADASVEARLSAEVAGYLPGTGRHVASYDDSDGRFDIFEFQTEASREQMGELDGIAVCRAAVKRPAKVGGFDCRQEEAAMPPRGILGVSIESVDGSTSILTLVGADVGTVLIEFNNGLVYSITPAAGIGYSRWRWGTGEVARVTAVYPDGSSESQEVG